MIHHICELCGYEYHPAEGDPENGIEENTDFEDLPETWLCPMCGAAKEDFAEEYTVVLAYEEIKAHIRRAHLKNAMKYHFFTPFRTQYPLTVYLREILESKRKSKK